MVFPNTVAIEIIERAYHIQLEKQGLPCLFLFSLIYYFQLDRQGEPFILDFDNVSRCLFTNKELKSLVTCAFIV